MTRHKRKDDGPVLPQRAYKYAAVVIDGLGILETQFRVGKWARNLLAEQEARSRRAYFRLVAKYAGEEYAGLRERESEKVIEAGEYRAVIKEHRVDARSKKKIGIEEEDKLALVNRELKAIRARLKEIRAGMHKNVEDMPEFKADLEALNEWDKKRRKRRLLRASMAGMFAPQRDFFRSCVKWSKTTRCPKPSGENWRSVNYRHTSSGARLTVEGALAGDPRLSIVPSPEGVWVQGSRRPKKLGDAVVRMCIGRRADVVTLAIRYHRPLPEGARITNAKITRDLVDGKWQYSFIVMVEKESFSDPFSAKTGLVGIDLGWRKREDGGLRIAVWVGDDGGCGELTLPGWWVREYMKTRDIASIRDEAFNEARAIAAEYDPAVAQWRSKSRLLARVSEWRGDESKWEAVGRLEHWAERERHLYHYEVNLRAQLRGSREDLYRRFAAHIRRRYAAAMIEDMDLRDFHKSKPLEQGVTDKDEAVKYYVRAACLSSLRMALSQGMAVTRLDPKDTTSGCYGCGTVNSVGGLPYYHCRLCGFMSDRDVHGAMNLVRLGAGAKPFEHPPTIASVMSVRARHDGVGNIGQRRNKKALEVGRITHADAG